jgi:dihydroorotate dehydrogenase (fumarate)
MIGTTYLGLKLRTPLVASASPLSQEIAGIRRLEDAGASAIVLFSLFEEQLHQERVELDYHLSAGTESFAESLTYFPQPSEFHTGPEEYLKHIQKAKAAVEVPVIASLNGSTLGGSGADMPSRLRTPVPMLSSATSTSSPPIQK